MAAPACRLALKITPGAPRDEVVGMLGEAVRVKLRAPPVDGKANQALVQLLADRLEVHASDIRLVSGAAGRHKVVELRSLSSDEARRRLLASQHPT